MRRVPGGRLPVVMLLVSALLAAPAAAQSPAPPVDRVAAERRAQRLVGQMTLDEKLSLVHGTGFATGSGYTGLTPGVSRLGIPPLFLADGPNGVGNGATGVTAFPAAIAAAATWDPRIMERYGAILGAEHAGKGNHVALAPTINLLRVPGWGRSFETLGEDPHLAGELGAAEVRGIQSRGVIATPKHYAVNNQETGRDTVSAELDERTLRELYLPHFEAAVRDGGALGVMCAYNRVRGRHACENPQLLDAILKREWGFRGFVVSDWWATHDTTAAALAGLDLEMPGGDDIPALPERFGERLRAAIASGAVPPARLDDMVRRILAARITLGQLDRPAAGDRDAVVTDGRHQAFARELAEAGTVLLRNEGGVLPLDPAAGGSIAVIGAAAQDAPVYTGGGSAAVIPSRTITPLEGIRSRAGAGVAYAPGTTGTDPLAVVPSALLTPARGDGPGLTAEYFDSMDFSGEPASTRVDPTVGFDTHPDGLSGSVRWTGTFTPASTGPHRFSFQNGGTARLYLDGRLVLANAAQVFGHGHAVVHLEADRPVAIRVEYVADTGFSLPGYVELGWQGPDPERIAAAVSAARAAATAVVFVNDIRTEGADLGSLRLPGDQDALIEAVAAVNPRTVVVLHTGGPVLMPWLHRVAAVVEAWYPGQESGAAIARVLFGDADPGGRLPVTFPASDAQGPLSTPERFPGTHGRVRYDEGLLIGHRWFDATGEVPAFPFGHGLSYADFAYDRLRVLVGRGPDARVRVRVRVTNRSATSGSEVAQLYLRLPPAAGAPPRQLKGFVKVRLRPGGRRTVAFSLTRRDLSTWDAAAGGWRRSPGRHRVMVGRSSRDIRAAAGFVLPGD